MNRPTCAVCPKPSYWHVWGVDLCPSDYASWCAWPNNNAAAIGRGLPHAEFVKRSTDETQRWLAQRKAQVSA